MTKRGSTNAPPCPLAWSQLCHYAYGELKKRERPPKEASHQSENLFCWPREPRLSPEQCPHSYGRRDLEKQKSKPGQGDTNKRATYSLLGPASCKRALRSPVGLKKKTCSSFKKSRDKKRLGSRRPAHGTREPSISCWLRNVAAQKKVCRVLCLAAVLGAYACPLPPPLSYSLEQGPILKAHSATDRSRRRVHRIEAPSRL